MIDDGAASLGGGRPANESEASLPVTLERDPRYGPPIADTYSGRRWMMKWTLVVLSLAVILLLLADFLAFHDLFEPHTGTEWLMLAASALAVIVLAGEASGRLWPADRE